MSKVNELFENSGRSNQGDNRNYFVKALNKVLEDGFISISIVQQGKVWTNPKYLDSTGKERKFNIIIKGYGMMRRIFLSSFDARELLLLVGEFIQQPVIADAHIKSISVKTDELCKCSRCSGMGIIEQFKYYCGGICFQCYGSKYEIVKKTVTV